MSHLNGASQGNHLGQFGAVTQTAEDWFLEQSRQAHFAAQQQVQQSQPAWYSQLGTTLLDISKSVVGGAPDVAKAYISAEAAKRLQTFHMPMPPVQTTALRVTPQSSAWASIPSWLPWAAAAALVFAWSRR